MEDFPEVELEPLFLAVESAINDHYRLYGRIKAARGMNRGLAMEAERISPGFLNKRNPIGFYTEATTSTNYRPALEAMSGGMLVALAIGMAGVMGILVAAYDRFFGGKGKGGEGGGMVGKAIAKLDAVDTMTESFREALHILHHPPGEIYEEAKEAQKEVAESYMKGERTFLTEFEYQLMVSQGAIYKAWTKVGQEGSITTKQYGEIEELVKKLEAAWMGGGKANEMVEMALNISSIVWDKRYEDGSFNDHVNAFDRHLQDGAEVHKFNNHNELLNSLFQNSGFLIKNADVQKKRLEAILGSGQQITDTISDLKSTVEKISADKSRVDEIEKEQVDKIKQGFKDAITFYQVFGRSTAQYTKTATAYHQVAKKTIEFLKQYYSLLNGLLKGTVYMERKYGEKAKEMPDAVKRAFAKLTAED